MWLGIESPEYWLASQGGRAPSGSGLSSQSYTKSQAKLFLFFQLPSPWYCSRNGRPSEWQNPVQRIGRTNTDIFLLCFSVVSPTSFQNVGEKWVPEIRRHCPKAPIILVGTQSDLREDVKVLIELDKCKEKPVPEEAAKLCAEEVKAVSYIECSALTQKNLKEVFDAAIVAGIQHSDSQAYFPEF